MRGYIALVRKDSDSQYGVEFPDLPGCISTGPTLDEALAQAREALEFHLEGMREDGIEWPQPRSVEAVMVERENRKAVAALIEVPEPKARQVRVNISIDEALLRRIDDAAAKVGSDRSSFFAVTSAHMIAALDISMSDPAAAKKLPAFPLHFTSAISALRRA